MLLQQVLHSAHALSPCGGVPSPLPSVLSSDEGSWVGPEGAQLVREAKAAGGRVGGRGPWAQCWRKGSPTACCQHRSHSRRCPLACASLPPLSPSLRERAAFCVTGALLCYSAAGLGLEGGNGSPPVSSPGHLQGQVEMLLPPPPLPSPPPPLHLPLGWIPSLVLSCSHASDLWWRSCYKLPWAWWRELVSCWCPVVLVSCVMLLTWCSSVVRPPLLVFLFPCLSSSRSWTVIHLPGASRQESGHALNPLAPPPTRPTSHSHLSLSLSSLW